MQRSMIAALFSSLLLGYAASPAWSAAGDAPKPAPATYVGNEVCQACHAPQFEKFATTLMGKIFLRSPRNEVEKSACENCHGPGSNHVAAGGGKGTGEMITFRKGSGETAEAQNEPVSAAISAASRPIGKRARTRTAVWRASTVTR